MLNNYINFLEVKISFIINFVSKISFTVGKTCFLATAKYFPLGGDVVKINLTTIWYYFVLIFIPPKWGQWGD